MKQTAKKMKEATTNRRSIRKHSKTNKPNLAIVPVAPAQIDYLRKEALAAPSIQQTVQKHKEIRHFIRRMLKSGIDYDNIPGTNGKTLLQPGAEKIAVWLKVRPMFDRVETDMGLGHIENVICAHMLPTLVYDLVMQVIEKGGANVDQAVAAIIRASELSNATASCSTMETNFRYRWADMRDEDGNPIKPNKLEASRKIAVNMARWLPAKMAFGKIVPLNKGDQKKGTPVEYWIYQERVENPNIYDERNKVRQMGEKRAFVKAIKRMGALSEVFQEDPNEWPETLDVRPEAPPEEPFKPGVVERDDPTPSNTPPIAQEVAQEVEKQKAGSKPTPNGYVHLVWQDKDLARVTGDIRDIEAWLIRECMAIKLQGKEELLLQAPYVHLLYELCEKKGLQIEEQPLLHKPKEARADAQEEQGVIKNAKKSAGKSTPNVQILFNGAWLYCYSTTLWPHLLTGVNKQARLLILRKEGRAPTVEGAITIGSVQFEADGKTVAA